MSRKHLTLQESLSKFTNNFIEERVTVAKNRTMKRDEFTKCCGECSDLLHKILDLLGSEDKKLVFQLESAMNISSYYEEEDVYLTGLGDGLEFARGLGETPSPLIQSAIKNLLYPLAAKQMEGGEEVV